jgi:hypothetical protein
MRCRRCLGQRQVKGMGGMLQQCAECNGKGTVTTINPTILHVKPNVPVETKTDYEAIENANIARGLGTTRANTNNIEALPNKLTDEYAPPIVPKRKPGRQPGYKPGSKAISPDNML